MDIDVKAKLESYPRDIRPALLRIRKLILDVAREDNVGEIIETLKWGEPSYFTKQGCAVRFDWKPKKPDQYAIYFNCRTSLVETFKEIYGDLFKYEGNRAIVFELYEKISEKQLKHCVSMSLRYKSLKTLPLLGA
jgi:hypothetical protein